MTEGALSRQTAERLIEAAIAAPSMHNSQPWRFVARLADRVIEIYADPARTLGQGDPRGRGVHMACGAALFNLRLAVAHAGSEPVARLLPSPRDPLLLASVRLAGPYRPRPAERDLHAAIGRRPSSRGPVNGHALPRGLLAALREAATLEGATLRLLDHADALRVLRRSAAADPGLRTDAGYLAELAAWTGSLRQSQNGLKASPGQALGQRRVGVAAGVLAMQGFAPHPDGSRFPGAALDTSPHLAVISTSADDRASWLRAGQATQRVLLLATHRGLEGAPLTPVPDALEAPLSRDPYRVGEHPAMILRLGCGRPGPATPRRPVTQVLRVLPPVSLRQATSAGQDKGPSEGPPPALSPPDRQLMPSK
jgi:nitroreductase